MGAKLDKNSENAKDSALKVTIALRKKTNTGGLAITSLVCCTIRTLILVLGLVIRTPSTAVKSCSKATEELLQSTAKIGGVRNANVSGWVHLSMRMPLVWRRKKGYSL